MRSKSSQRLKCWRAQLTLLCVLRYHDHCCFLSGEELRIAVGCLLLGPNMLPPQRIDRLTQLRFHLNVYLGGTTRRPNLVARGDTHQPQTEQDIRILRSASAYFLMIFRKLCRYSPCSNNCPGGRSSSAIRLVFFLLLLRYTLFLFRAGVNKN